MVLEPPGELIRNRGNLDFDTDVKGAAARQRFREFFRNFRQGNVFIYRETLVRQWNRREFFVEVDLSHVNEYDEILFNNLQSRPAEFLEMFENAAKDALKYFLTEKSATEASVGAIPDFQVILRSAQLSHSLRNLTAEHVNKLIKVSVFPSIELHAHAGSNSHSFLRLTVSPSLNRSQVLSSAVQNLAPRQP